MREQQWLATTRWCIGDVLGEAEAHKIRLTDEQAMDLLESIEEDIQDAAIQAGFDVIERALAARNWEE